MKGSSERWPKRWLNDDHFLSFSVLTDTSPQRESSKTTSLLVRNHSFFHGCCCFFFCCCLFCCFCFCYFFFSITCSFHVHNTKPSGTMGDTQKTMTISAMSFRGCNRFSPSLICWNSEGRSCHRLQLDGIRTVIVVHLPWGSLRCQSIKSMNMVMCLFPMEQALYTEIV